MIFEDAELFSKNLGKLRGSSAPGPPSLGAAGLQMMLQRQSLGRTASATTVAAVNPPANAAPSATSSASSLVNMSSAVACNAGFQDFHDPEINRLFAASPPAADEMVSYNFERENKKKDSKAVAQLKQLQQQQQHAEEESDEPAGEASGPDETSKSAEDIDMAKDLPSFDSLLEEYAVPARPQTTAPPAPSLLSLQLRQEHAKALSKMVEPDESDLKKITIYSPKREPILVSVSDNDTVADVIKKALAAHLKANMQFKLHYHAPECYEIRLHEGDGEPDEDFPALDRKRLLSHFGNMNEYCLCRNNDPVPRASLKVDVAAPAKAPEGEPDASERESVSVRRSQSLGATAMAAAVRDSAVAALSGLISPVRRGSRNSEVGSPGAGAPTFFRDERANSAVPKMTTATPAAPVMPESDTVTVLLPNSSYVKIKVTETTTPKDLIHMISKKHRLRMFTGEFTFLLSPADQTRLQRSSRILEPDALIAKLGVEKLEFTRRVYGDDPAKPDLLSKTAVAQGAQEFERPSMLAKEEQAQGQNSRENILYTDVTAAVYQEWNVLKKNKFGRVQERIMGVDSSKVYNYETQTRNAASVKNAQRSLSNVKKIEYVPGDNKSFRIVWIEETKELYEIEYTCRTSRDCAEIVSKITYLLNANGKR